MLTSQASLVNLQNSICQADADKPKITHQSDADKQFQLINLMLTPLA